MTTAGYISRLERRLALAIARGDRIGAPALRARIDAETRAPLASNRRPRDGLGMDPNPMQRRRAVSGTATSATRTAPSSGSYSGSIAPCIVKASRSRPAMTTASNMSIEPRAAPRPRSACRIGTDP